MTVCLNNKCVVATPQHINYWVDFRNKIIKNFNSPPARQTVRFPNQQNVKDCHDRDNSSS